MATWQIDWRCSSSSSDTPKQAGRQQKLEIPTSLVWIQDDWRQSGESMFCCSHWNQHEGPSCWPSSTSSCTRWRRVPAPPWQSQSDTSEQQNSEVWTKRPEIQRLRINTNQRKTTLQVKSGSTSAKWRILSQRVESVAPPTLRFFLSPPGWWVSDFRW